MEEKMNQTLFGYLNQAKNVLVESLMNFLNEYGLDITEREMCDFGLDVEESNISKIWNFYEQNGCTTVNRIDKNECDLSDAKENLHDFLYFRFEYTAFQCIYIAEESGVGPQLMWYGFVNGGINFDEDQAEPQHGYVRDLSLADIEEIIEQMRIDSLDYSHYKK